MTDIPLRCRCGQVRGVLHGASTTVGNHLVCYCESCQRFPAHLGAEGVVDEFGGTDIYQVPIGAIEFTSGTDKIRCLHLTEGGPYRWYAGYCDAPIGNSWNPSLPFMGVIHTAMEVDDLDVVIGPVRFDSFREDARTTLPQERSRGWMPMLWVRFIAQMLYWRLSGKAKPNPLFLKSGTPIVKPELVTR
jgi:hypothetical protein